MSINGMSKSSMYYEHNLGLEAFKDAVKDVKTSIEDAFQETVNLQDLTVSKQTVVDIFYKNNPKTEEASEKIKGLFERNKESIKTLRKSLDPQAKEFSHCRQYFNKTIDLMYENKNTQHDAMILDYLVEQGTYIKLFIRPSCSIM